MHKFFALQDIVHVVEGKDRSLEPLSAYMYYKVMALADANTTFFKDIQNTVRSLFTAIDNGSLALMLTAEQITIFQEHGRNLIDNNSSPLVLDNGYLYLRRYWRLEESFVSLVKNFLFSRAKQSSWMVDKAISEELLVKWKNNEPTMSETLYQAGQCILQSDFLLLSGGPGSGKTYSLARVLKLLDMMAGVEQRRLSVLLSAPTAKAVARIHESLMESFKSMGQLEYFDISLHTLHRALGYSIKGEPKYHRQNPWSYDLVVIDEVSMVDIYLFGQLLSALKPSCKIILIGDADQLPSVASGAVLSELVYWYVNQSQLEPQYFYALMNNIIFLKGNRRVPPEILSLAHNFLSGEVEEVENKFKTVRSERMQFYPLSQYTPNRFYAWLSKEYQLKEVVNTPLGVYDEDVGLTDDQKHIVASFFQKYEDFIVISPIHQGAYGVQTINQMLRKSLGNEVELYHGMPIVLTVNQPAYELSNGDRGVILNFDGTYYAVFKHNQNLYNCYLPSELVDYEVAYAITVHKSQGSEYQRVVIVLPENAERLLERRLIYTAITRAKSQVQLFSELQELLITTKNISPRVSNIAHKLLALVE